MKKYKNFVTEAGRCWPGHKPVPGKKPFTPGSCVKEEVLEEGRPSQRHPLEGHDYHKKTDAELTYIAKDAHEAAEAMKSHNTAAENKYRDQANDSATVRYWRQKHGMPDWYKKKYGHIKEEVEQIDELKTSTLLRYQTKANQALIGGDRNKEEKRIKGIQTARYKIQNRYKVKEEVELDEAIPKSTGYALVHSSSKKIVAKGNKEEMMKKMKEANAKEKGSHHLGMTYRGKVGDTFGEEVEKVVAEGVNQSSAKTGIYQSEVYGTKAYHSKCLEKGCDWESRRYDRIKQAQDAAKKHAQTHIKQGVAEKVEIDEAMRSGFDYERAARAREQMKAKGFEPGSRPYTWKRIATKPQEPQEAPEKKNKDVNESAAWQRKEGKNPEGGLNRKGIASYRRENPGSKLSMAVTTPPSKLKPGSKAANRRKSFCARMGGMPGPMKKPNGEPTRKALSLKKWNC